MAEGLHGEGRGGEGGGAGGGGGARRGRQRVVVVHHDGCLLHALVQGDRPEHLLGVERVEDVEVGGAGGGGGGPLVLLGALQLLTSIGSNVLAQNPTLTVYINIIKLVKILSHFVRSSHRIEGSYNNFEYVLHKKWMDLVAIKL